MKLITGKIRIKYMLIYIVFIKVILLVYISSRIDKYYDTKENIILLRN